MFISKTLIFLHFEKEGKATGVVFCFFFWFWIMKEIFYWLNIPVPLHSQPIRAKTRTKRDALARVYSRTLTALMSSKVIHCTS